MTDSNLALARKLVAMVNAREQESVRVAAFLHDDVGQVLSAVGLQLDVLRMDLCDRAPEIVERTAEIQQVLGAAVERLRNLSYELNPSIVERAGFQFALDRLIGHQRDQFQGSIRFLYDSSVRPPREMANIMFKIAEHGLDNAVRHSRAQQIEVLVRPTGRGTTLEIRDNGIGFDKPRPGVPPTGLGLLLMEHYATQAGLEFAVKSAPGKGTIIKTSHRISPAEAGGPAAAGQALVGGVETVAGVREPGSLKDVNHGG
jgi:signal transduction histidine kinase